MASSGRRRLSLRQCGGGASGGTIDSLRTAVDTVKKDPPSRRVLADPYALSPDRAAEPDLGSERDSLKPLRDDRLGGWLAPFVMGSINTRVVRRSNALQDHAYGRRFRYRELMLTGRGLFGGAKAAGVAGGIAGVFAGLATPGARQLLDRVLPDPGEGPSESARERGFFDIDIHTTTSSGRAPTLRNPRIGRSWLQGDGGHARRKRALPRARQPSRGRGRAHACVGDGSRACRSPHRSGAHLSSGPRLSGDRRSAALGGRIGPPLLQKPPQLRGFCSLVAPATLPGAPRGYQASEIAAGPPSRDHVVSRALPTRRCHVGVEGLIGARVAESFDHLVERSRVCDGAVHGAQAHDRPVLVCEREPVE